MNKGTLDSFGLWCPFCGKNTIRKTIGGCKFILCENFINCDYFEIKEYNVIGNKKNNNEKNEENKENYCIKKLKQFITDEKIDEYNRNNKYRDNNQGQSGIKSSKNTLKSNELGFYENEEEYDIKFILNILNEGKREKTKIELYREDSKWKRQRNNQLRIAKQQNRRIKRFKKEKEKKIKKEEWLKKEELKKEKTILKIFKEKYEKFFGSEKLVLENISTKHFKKEEIGAGLKEYDKQQLSIQKKIKDRKEKERIKELKKIRRKLEF